MYQKILVPLDGSELAECVLSHVEAIAGGCRAASVVLARVVEPVTVPGRTGMIPREIRQEAEADAESEAWRYLAGVADRLKARLHGISTLETRVLKGKAPETLTDYARENGVDLIVIATHGRSGVSRWVWGSVADRILRSAPAPVLMVRAPGCVIGV